MKKKIIVNAEMNRNTDVQYVRKIIDNTGLRHQGIAALLVLFILLLTSNNA